MLIGGLGLGFEVSNWYLIERGMQNAADAAALAASSNGTSNYDVEAKAVAARYGFTTGVTVANNVACPGGGSTCYSVSILGSVPLYLSPVVGYAGNGSGRQNLSATAIATKTFNRPYCMLALASSGAQGIRTSGAPSANLAGCSIKSNTSATCSGHNLGADVGDAVNTNNGCGVSENSGVTPSVDPYSGLASNIPSNTCSSSYPQEPGKNGTPLPASNRWVGNQNWSGNKIVCGDLQLTGNVTINASSGVLVIENGQLDTHGYTIQTSSGSALTIVFSGTNGGGYTHATTGSGTIDIAAPTSGPWSGVAIYQDPILTSGVDVSAAGNSPTWDITGLVYLPHSSVTLDGAINKSTNGQSCTALVADNITIKGTGDILAKGQCPAAGLTMPKGARSRGQLVS
jgi:Flp pilus assembly protein TadG